MRHNIVNTIIIITILILTTGCKTTGTNKGITDETQQPTPAEAPTYPGQLISEPVIYESNGRKMLGYLAKYENTDTETPILILLHDAYGLDTWTQNQAESYAKLGYIVICPSMTDFGDSARDQPVIDNVQAALSLIQTRYEINENPDIGVIGWSTGGGTYALTCARYMDLKIAVICYGHLLANEEGLLGINEPLLGLFGLGDDQILISEIEAFQKAIENIGGTFTANIWRGERHNFMREPQNPEKAKEAQLEIINWLNRHIPPKK